MKDETAHRGTEGGWGDGHGQVPSSSPPVYAAPTQTSNPYRDSGDVITQIADALTCPNPRCNCHSRRGKSWLVHCPAHADATPSLSVSMNGSKPLVHCLAGCSQEAVIDALRERDLWPQRNGDSSPEAVYTYRDESGAPLFEVCRFPGKRFAQRRPGAKDWGIDGVRRVLYRLPELVAADPESPVYVCEGEKDADRLAALGLVATTNPGGAGKWRDEYGQYLRGRKVVSLPDNDDPGRSHAQQVAASLAGVAAEVRLLALPDLSEKGDVSDWLAAGHTAEELVRLAAEAPLWEPPQAEDGAALLDEVSAFIKRYVAMPEEQTDACTLWVAHSHAFAAAETTPYLHITSAEKQSGKSRLLETLELVVARPWHTSRASVAALVRKVSDGVTLLLDETDRSFEREKEYAAALLQILNAGYRQGAKATLCMGNKNEVVDMPVFCAKAIAGLGSLPDTVEDRSILIAMKRAGPGEKVAKLRHRQGKAEGWPIRDRLSAWAQPHLTELEEARPDLPDALSARQEDCWEPLMAIADLVGGDWPQRARRAAITLSVRQEDQSLGVQLLDNIRCIFGEHGDPERLVTSALLADLNEREEWAWGVIDHGKPLTTHRLAAMLKPLGPRPNLRREGEARSRGYHRHDFVDPWQRYLPGGYTPQESVPSVPIDPGLPRQSYLSEPGGTLGTVGTLPQGVPARSEGCAHQTPEQVAERWEYAKKKGVEVRMCPCCGSPTLAPEGQPCKKCREQS